MSWNPVADAAGYAVQWKTGVQSFGASERSDEAEATSYRITGLAPATAYTVRVVAYDDASPPGVLAYAEAAGTTNAPDFTVTLAPFPGNAGRLELTWTSLPDATSFRFFRKPAAQAGEPAQFQEVARNVFRQPDATVLSTTWTGSPGTAYLYRVCAYDGAVLLACGEATATTFAAPGGLTVAPVPASTSELAVSWTEAAGAAGYVVEWKKGSESYGASYRTREVGADATGWTITTLSANTAYDVRVRARYDRPDGRRVDGGSAEKRATTNAADTLKNLTVTPAAGSSTGLAVAWTPHSGAASHVVQWKTPPTAAWSETTQASLGGSASSHTITGLRPRTVYAVRVVAWDDATPPDVLAFAEGGDRTRWAVPRLRVAAPAGSTDKLSVSWNAPSGVAGTDKYRVQWKSGAQSYSTSERHQEKAAAARSHTITGLVPGTTYTVRVVAIDTDPDPDQELAAAEASAVAGSALGTVTVAAVSGDPTRLSVSWTGLDKALSDADPPALVTLTVTGYAIEWKSGGQEYAAARRTSVDGTASSVRLSHLDPRTAYTVRVTSTSAANLSATAEGRGTTAAAPAALAALSVAPVAGEATKLAVSWTAHPGAASHVVQWKAAGGEYGTAARASLGAAADAREITGLAAGTAYTVRVTAYDGASPAGVLAFAEASGRTHGAPEGLAVAPVAGRASELEASWTAVPGAVSYRVQWKAAGGAYGATDRANPDAARHRITGLSAGTAYTVRVTPIVAGTLEAPDGLSAEASGTTHAALTGLTVVAAADSTSALDVSWTNVSGNAGYRVQWKGPGQAYATAERAHTTAADAVAYTITGLAAGTAYDVRVTARHGSGEDAHDGDAAEARATTGTALPGLAVAPVPGRTTELSVSWTPVAGAARYRVRWKTGAGDFGRGVEVTGASHPLTALAARTTYTVEVVALDTAAGPAEELARGEASGTTLAPFAGLAVAAASATELAVGWEAVAGATGYRVQWKSGAEAYSDTQRVHTAAAGAVAYTITGLAAATAYDVRVTARHGTAADAFDGDAATASATTAAALAGLAAARVAGSASDLDVSWTPWPGAASHVVEWRTGAGAYSSAARASLGGTAARYRIGGLAAGTGYTVRVTAHDGASPARVLASAEAAAGTHAALAGLAVTPVAASTSALDVAWTPVSGAASYRVQWKTGAGAYGATDRANPAAAAHRITDLAAGTTYRVRVTPILTGTLDAPDGAGAEASGTTHAALTGLTVAPVADTAGELSVGWNAVSGASGYRVQWRTGHGAFNDGTTVTAASHALEGLAEGTAYDVRVTARVGEGAAAVDGGSAEATGTTWSGLPGLAVSPVAGSTTALDVAWKSVSAAVSYRVQWKTGAGAYGTTDRANPTAATHRITGLAPGTTYAVRVSVIDKGTLDAPDGDSGEASGTTHAALTGLAAAPVAASTTELAVSWNAVARATGYVVQWKSGAESWSASERRHAAGAGATGWTITGLAADTAYDVRVTARHALGGATVDGDSAEASATTHDAMGGVTGLAVSPVAGRPDRLAVAWTAYSGAASHVVQWKTAGGAYSAAARAALGSTASAHTIEDLSPGTAYTVRVVAYDAASPPAVLAFAEAGGATHPGLTGLAVSPVAGSSTGLAVSWNAVADASGYVVQWKTGAQGYHASERRHAAGADATGWTISGLAGNTAYAVKVTARHVLGGETVDGDSDEASATTHPPISVRVEPVAATGSELNVWWQSVSGSGGYVVQWKTGAESYSASERRLEGLSPSSVWPPLSSDAGHRITGLAPGTAYDVKVSAKAAGSGEASATTGAAMDGLSGLAVSRVAGTGTALDVSWPAVAGAAGYVVQWKTGAQSFSPNERSHEAAAGATGYRITGLDPGTAYTVRVVAWDDASPATRLGFAEASATTLPALAGLRVEAVAGRSDRLAVSWAAVARAEKFRVQWKTGAQSFGPSERSHETGAGATGWTITGLAAGTAYTVRVVAVDTDPDPDVELAAAEATGTTASAFSVTVAAVSGDPTQLDVSWAAVALVNNYVVEWKSGGQGYDGTRRVVRDEDVARKVRLSDLDPGTTYTVRVTALLVGTEKGVAEGTGTTGTAPAALAALSVAPVTDDATKLAASWTAHPGASSHVVRWKTSGGEYGTAARASLGGTASSHTISGLTAGTGYTVRVVAYDGSTPAGVLAFAETSGATPVVLAVAPVAGRASELEASWTAVPGAASYRVQWKAAGGAYGATDRANPSAARYRITGLDPGTAYTVRVTAIVSGTLEAPDGPGAEESATTHAALTGLTVAAAGTSSLNVSWTNVSGNAGYRVQWKGPGQAYATAERAHTTAADATSYPIADLAEGTAYDVRVAVRLGSGADAYDGDAAEARASTDTGLPGLAVAPVPGRTTELSVSWKPVADADRYRIRRKTGAGEFDSGVEVTGASHILTGLAAGTTYTVEVAAVDTGESKELAKGEASGTTLAALAGLAVTAGGATELDVRWQAVSGATGYVVQWKSGTESWSTAERMHTAAADATSYRITGLAASTAHDVRVTARHGAGADAFDGDAATASATTAAGLAGLAAARVAGSASELDVSWTAFPGAASHVVEWRTGAGAYSSAARASLGAAAAAYRIGGLAAGTGYTVRVTAYDDASPARVLASAETTASPWAVPGGLTVAPVAATASELAVSWNAVSGATGYVVQWKTGLQSFSASERRHAAGADATGWTITDLAAATAYDVRVTARHVLGGATVDGGSAEASGTTGALGGVADLAVAPVAGETTKLAVTWTAHPRAAVHVVQWKTGGAWSGASEASLGAAASSHTITGLAPGTTYTVRVVAWEAAGPSGLLGLARAAGATFPALGTVTVAPPVDAATGLNRTTELAVSWNAVSGARGFVVEWKTGAQSWGASARRHETGAGATGWTIPGLSPATAYDVRVTARHALGGATVDGDSGEASATTHAAGTLGGLAVSPVTGSPGVLDVSWTPRAGAARHVVEWKTGAQAYGASARRHEAGPAAMTYRITGLRPGTRYTVRVAAYDYESPAGVLAFAEANGTTNAPDITVTLAPVSGKGTELALSWTTVPGATGYAWEYTHQGSAVRGTGAGTDTGAALTGLAPGTSYTVRVCARDGAVDLVCGEATATPHAAPAGLAVSQVAGSISALDATWTPVAGAVSYRVDWTHGGLEYDTTRRANPTDARHRITGLTAGTTYTVRVTPIVTGTLDAPDGLPATVDAVVLMPPANLLVSPAADTTVTTKLRVTWTRPSGSQPSGYLVQWKTGLQSFSTSERRKEVGSDASGDTITGLAEGTAYDVRVTARYLAGGRTVDGGFAEGSAKTWSLRAGLAVTPVAGRSDQLEVTWDAVPGAPRYRVEWKSGSEDFDASRGVEQAARSYRITDLAPATTYTVRVAGGKKTFSDWGAASGTTHAAMSAVSVAPVAGSTAALDVSWSALDYATGYVVRWRPDGAASWSDANRAEATPGTAATWRITDLAAATTYDVSVTYRVGTGASAAEGASASASGTTLGAPGGLSVAAVGGSPYQLDVSWQAVSGATGYVVQWKSGDESYSTTERVHTAAADAVAYRIGSLSPATGYDVKVTARVSLGGATVDGGSAEAGGTTGFAPLTGLKVAPVSGDPTKLDVSWHPVEGAATYVVQWKSGDESYSLSERVLTLGRNATTPQLTGLSAATEYDVKVTYQVYIGGVEQDAGSAEASGTTAAGGLRFTVGAFTADRLSISIAAGQILAPPGATGTGVLVLMDLTGPSNGSWINSWSRETVDDERRAGTAQGRLGRGTVSAALSHLTDAADGGSDNARIGLFPTLSGGDTVGQAIEVVWQGTGWFDPTAVDSLSLVWQGRVQSTVGLSGQTVTALPAAVLDLQAGSDTGVSSTDDITSDTTPTIGLSGLEVGAKVTLTATKGDSAKEIVIASAVAASRSETFETLEDGEWTVTAVQEAAGKVRSVSAPLVVTVDTTGPGVVGMSRVGTGILAAGAADTLLIGFSEAVGGFTLADISASAGTVTALAPSTSDPKLYSATYTAPSPASGSATVSIAAGAVTDLAGNASTAAAHFGIDFEAPGVVVDTDPDTTGAQHGLTVAETDDADIGSVEEDKAAYTVVLKTRPAGAVTVTPSSGDTAAATVSPSALTFTTANWNTPQTVTVTAVDDDLDNPGDARTATVTHTVAGYGSVTTAASVTVTVSDDDALTGLKVEAVSGETTKLSVSWASYSVLFRRLFDDRFPGLFRATDARISHSVP